MRVAMISYNTFVPGEDNGWKARGRNRVLLLQNRSGERQKDADYFKHPPKTDRGTESYELLNILGEEMSGVDSVVAYLGVDTTILGYLGQIKIPQGVPFPNLGDIIFLSCPCDKEEKQELIELYHFSKSRILPCACGGHEAMAEIFRFLVGETRVSED